MHVHQILKSKGDGPVITITSKTSIAEAANVLAERRIGGLIVSSDGTQVEGILSERDIVRSLALRGAVCLEETVGDLMTRNPVCCSKDDTADSVLQKMTNGRFRHMPVTEDGALVGIITIGDAAGQKGKQNSTKRYTNHPHRQLI